MSAFALTLGEFERETYQESLLVAFFFHYFTVFVNIVLLNVRLIIAINHQYSAATQPQIFNQHQATHSEKRVPSLPPTDS